MRFSNPRQQPSIICADGTRVHSVEACPPTFATRRGMPGTGPALAFQNPISLPALQQARPAAQAMLDFVAASRGPQAAQGGCTWYGNACCRLMSTGVWRCSYPGGACTPGLEACPAWLTAEITRQSDYAGSMQLSVPIGVPVPQRLRRLRARQLRELALVASRSRYGI